MGAYEVGLVVGEALWAVVGFVVLVSIVLHGITASPVMAARERRDARAHDEIDA